MLWFVIFLAAASQCVHAQLTAQSSVAPDLRECYTNSYLVDKNNLPPTTLQVLIDIIQKIEDDPNVNLDLRQLVIVLLHTYKQDGIEFHQPEANMLLSANVLPFAPTFHSFHRHRILLSRILSNTVQVFGNNTLNSSLKCAFHQMISTTVDARVRGNENNCNRLSQYRALRTARDIPKYLKMKDDVEFLNLDSLPQAKTNGQMRHFNPKDDVEYQSHPGVTKYERQVLGDSQCPLLSGAIYTKWGAVSAGHLLAGIAAGAQFQRIPVTEIAKGSIINFPNVQSTVSSIFASTVSGDLAEAILIQGTETGQSTVSVGLAGNWNTTQAPRFYMLNNRVNVEMTDPEISGDIDGFVLGTLLNTELSGSGSIRLSQLLDMYYSERNGVFNPVRRACNRRQLSQDFIDRNTLVEETNAFTAALDTNMPLRGTIVGGISELVNSAVNSFQSYTTNNMNNLICETTEVTASFFRMKTNLILVLDSSWQYQTIYPAISYLLDNIEVGKFGSSVTLLNAFNGDTVVNKTFSLADFHSNYTQATHQNSIANGVNLESTLSNIRIMMLSELENEKTANYVGGNSTVLLFLLNAGNIQNNQAIFNQARLMNETVPDLRIMFATASNQFDNLWNLVRDMHNDIRTISLNSDGTNVANTMSPILQNIQSVGRRIVNSNCGSFADSQAESGIRQFDDYVEPGYTNYYSISPNYFFRDHDNRKIRISRTGAGVGSLIICQSRTVSMPRQNTTTAGAEDNAVICQSLASGSIEISLQGACNGYSRIVDCPFFHVSVQSSVTAATTLSSTCTERACRFPYDIRFQVQIENFGCFNAAGRFNISFSLLMFAFLLYFKLF